MDIMSWHLPGQWPDGGLSDRYGHEGPGICLGNEQTEAEGVMSQGGCCDTLAQEYTQIPNLTERGPPQCKVHKCSVQFRHLHIVHDSQLELVVLSVIDKEAA